MTQLDTTLLEQANPSTTRRTALKGALGLSVGGALAASGAANASAAPKDFGIWMTIIAQQKKGARYVWGSQGPNTFDCAGLIRWTYHELTGNWLPVGTYAQFNCRQIIRRPGTRSLSTVGGYAAIGDPVFFWNGSSIGHIGLYMGKGNILSATTSSGVVTKPATAFSGTYRSVYTGYWR